MNVRRENCLLRRCFYKLECSRHFLSRNDYLV